MTHEQPILNLISVCYGYLRPFGKSDRERMKYSIITFQELKNLQIELEKQYSKTISIAGDSRNDIISGILEFIASNR